MVARVMGVVAGVWLMVSPAALDYIGTAAETSDRVVGPIAAASSFIAMWGVVRSLRWVGLAVGVYCLVAPWLLGFPLAAALSNLLAGMALAGASVVGGGNAERFGGGWRSLVDEDALVGPGSTVRGAVQKNDDHG